MLIGEMMRLARLNAKSYGKKYIDVEDYLLAKKLMSDSLAK
jgi:hypothetical protein